MTAFGARNFFRLAMLLALTWVMPASDLVPSGVTWLYFKGVAEPSPSNLSAWREPGFNASSWASGRAPFSYGMNLTSGTLLTDMQGGYSTLYLRTSFNISNVELVQELALEAAVDDGFVVWLNGQEVVRYNAGPGHRPFNDHVAPDRATVSIASPVETIRYELNTAVLVEGANVLAVQLLNSALYSNDILLNARLVASVEEVDPPVIASVSPAPGSVFTELQPIEVTFSESVTGVEASDLLLNGEPALSVMSPDQIVYTFQPPALGYGTIEVSWHPNHGITDLAVTPNTFDALAETATWSYALVDPSHPMVVQSAPPADHTVQSLSQAALWFNKPVTGVVAEDLLVDGTPALRVTGFSAGPYVFEFDPVLVNGLVTLGLRVDHNITDTNPEPMRVQSASWSVTVDSDAPLPSLRINEFLAVNLSGLTDEDRETSGWIEIHNFGEDWINLEGYGLTDSEDLPFKWVFPSRTLGPGAYVVVFASGKDRRPENSQRRLHTNFRLARTGEYLALVKPEYPPVIISEFSPEFPRQHADYSYGEIDTLEISALGYFATPTPGQANGTTDITGICAPVVFSVGRGFYAQPLEVSLTCATPGSQIRYTIDGSEPTSTHGVLVTGPVPIRQALVLRAIAFAEGHVPSPVETHSFLVNPTIMQASVPTISLATATNNLIGPTGIVGMQGGRRDGGVWVSTGPNDYFNPMNQGFDWERPVSVEFLNPLDNSGFQADAGLRLHASGYFRPRLTPASKFSWRLYFRRDYGEGKLRFPFLDPWVSTMSEFDALVCRAGSNDLNPFIKDELVRRLQLDCGQVSSVGSIVALYMNARFSGIYNPVERINSDFLQLHHGGGPEWDVLSQNGALDGDSQNFDAMLRFVRENDPAVRGNYEAATRWIDMTNFIDYLLVNSYGFNGDWPHNNWRAGRERREGALWRFYVWDAEWSFGTYGRSIAGNTFGDLTGNNAISTLYQRLRRQPEFRVLFADRAHRHLFNSGALTPDNVRKRFDELFESTRRLLPSLDRYIPNVWIPNRPAHLHRHLDTAGVFASSNAPSLRQHGGNVVPGFNLTMTNRQGIIWYTTDGSDPRIAFTGAVSGRSLQYSPQNPPIIHTDVRVLARSLHQGNWSALVDARFTLQGLPESLRITELAHDPSGGPEYQFLELTNLGNSDRDLSGYHFDGIEFRFAVGSRIPAGASWVLASARNPEAFMARYPGILPVGYFGGRLHPEGEHIRLLDAHGNVVDHISYQTGPAWPDASATTGFTLIRSPIEGDPHTPASWQASADQGGSPGAYPPPNPVPHPIRFTEVLAQNLTAYAHRNTYPDYVELLATSTDVVDLSGYRFRRADRDDAYVFPEGTQLLAGNRLVVWCDREAFNGEHHAGFALAREGGTLLLEDATGRRIDAIAYGFQIPDVSLGLVENGKWTGIRASPGNANMPIELAEGHQLVFNEILARPTSRSTGFIELWNDDSEKPMDLLGWKLVYRNQSHSFLLPTFIAAKGFLRVYLDPQPDSLNVDINLSSTGATLQLRDPQDNPQASLVIDPHPVGASVGRHPDGGPWHGPLGYPTPDAPNRIRLTQGPRFNEVLASSSPENEYGWIEILNPDNQPYPMEGSQIVMEARTRESWTFPPQFHLQANGYFVLKTGDSPLVPPIGTPRTTWPIPVTGARMLLLDARGDVLDDLLFGHQIPGRSIGSSTVGWQLLGELSPSRPNTPAAQLGTVSSITINEWLTDSDDMPDFVELYNSAPFPISIGEMRLTDDPSIAGRDRFIVAPLSFIGPMAWAVWTADGRPDRGPAHLPFGLSQNGETLRLYNATRTLMDQVTVVPHSGPNSFGRYPDGSVRIMQLPVPTPGDSNGGDLDSDKDGMPDIWEILNGLDPFFAGDAAEDADGDGVSNLGEYLAGTDPNDPESVLSLTMAPTLTGVELKFRALAGRSYSLLVTEDLADPNGWTPLFHVDPPSQDRPYEFLIQVNSSTPLRLYRVATPSWP